MTDWPRPVPNVATFTAQVKSHARNFGISGWNEPAELESAAATAGMLQNAAVPSILAPASNNTLILRIIFLTHHFDGKYC
jgi:hypothetical protein